MDVFKLQLVFVQVGWNTEDMALIRFRVETRAGLASEGKRVGSVWKTARWNLGLVEIW